MLIKREFHPKELAQFLTQRDRLLDRGLTKEEAEAKLQQPRCIHVEVKHTGVHPEQNFSSRMVMNAVSEGWMVIEGDKLTIKTCEHQPNLVYTINRSPGHYALQDGSRIPISDLAKEERQRTGIGRLSAKEALAYITAKGFTNKGYEVIDHFECVLDSALHDQFKLESVGV